MAAVEPSSPTLRDRHVLIVEDDPDIRHMIALVLKSTGAVIEEAASAAEAERRLCEREFDLLLLDWNLVDMPAAELLDRADQHRPGTSSRCVVITGDLIRHGDPHEAERRGLSLLRKPFRPGELLEAVHRAIGS